MSVQGGVKGHVGGSIRRDRERQHEAFVYISGAAREALYIIAKEGQLC